MVNMIETVGDGFMRGARPVESLVRAGVRHEENPVKFYTRRFIQQTARRFAEARMRRLCKK